MAATSPCGSEDQFYISPQLGFCPPLYNQTLIQVLLGWYFADVVNTYNVLSLEIILGNISGSLSVGQKIFQNRAEVSLNKIRFCLWNTPLAPAQDLPRSSQAALSGKTSHSQKPICCNELISLCIHIHVTGSVSLVETWLTQLLFTFCFK